MKKPITSSLFVMYNTSFYTWVSHLPSVISICATFEVIIDLIQDRTSTNVIELLASGANRSLLRHIAQ